MVLTELKAQLVLWEDILLIFFSRLDFISTDVDQNHGGLEMKWSPQEHIQDGE